MSTLHVENLKGLSSGGNANKIIIPSGQTLDASNGFTTPAGHVIQVVQTTSTTSTTVTSSLTWTNVNPTATITPKFSNSKILITHTAGGMSNITGEGSSHGLRILRGSTNIASRARHGYLGSTTVDWLPIAWHIDFLDSPATTSATTYQVQILQEKSGNLRHSSGDSNISPSTTIATTTLMEIAQ